MRFLSSVTAASSIAAASAQFCNPAKAPPGPFRLSTFDPATNRSTPLTIGVASRSVRILAVKGAGDLEDNYTFAFDGDTGRLHVPGVGYSDDAIVNHPLTFAVSGGTSAGGGLALKTVERCFWGEQMPLFLVVGNGNGSVPVTEELALTGWSVCQNSAIFWIGEAVPEITCRKGGVQVWLLGSPLV
ncbi:hypothetical protein GGR54DRAFT_432188 [Hypoxylon sp. NC1633]|nr:hypothetical protein GGR54DRAFT_432188 [Hypoxylon sp. NC1633]